MPINKIFYLELVDDARFGCTVLPKKKSQTKDKFVDNNDDNGNGKHRSGVFNKQ